VDSSFGGKLPGQLAQKWNHPQAAAINAMSSIGIAHGHNDDYSNKDQNSKHDKGECVQGGPIPPSPRYSRRTGSRTSNPAMTWRWSSTHTPAAFSWEKLIM
jgi:hypothetical protein